MSTTEGTTMKCAHCGNYIDQARVIGWDRRYCRPLCEKLAMEAAADAFQAWWERKR